MGYLFALVPRRLHGRYRVTLFRLTASVVEMVPNNTATMAPIAGHASNNTQRIIANPP
jgi:hypothetical protein